MTEKEKAERGMFYDANYDEQLLAERDLCKDKCFKFNSTLPSERDRRFEILKDIVGECGSRAAVESPFWCDYGYNIKLGENFYANHNLVILDCAEVRFGDNVFIAPNCAFYCAGHPLGKEERNRGLEYALPITVGDDVWIGGNTVVLPGVSIGSGSVIGAGSVVVSDIPSGVVAFGNPCRPVRKITERDREKLPSAAKR